ncbi:YlzJ-like family protein [Paenibacillus qinlingensis]|uniref:YlzJ-like family protein n=1 Tax=Paenibacillus qinlingensis TaxID=1837343 RepID=UPI0015661338|nr:YlzJ-like family protein [Paenibacillus qinlingensis]NQX57330.1 YlzJ-like family protein [Paenibacillus qinlingensis]
MIHYSVIPMEVIFEGFDAFSPQYLDIEVDGMMMQIEPLSGYQARIVRLYSCNPQDYLNEHYMPGSLISYQPQLAVNSAH